MISIMNIIQSKYCGEQIRSMIQDRGVVWSKWKGKLPGKGTNIFENIYLTRDFTMINLFQFYNSERCYRLQQTYFKNRQKEWSKVPMLIK